MATLIDTIFDEASLIPPWTGFDNPGGRVPLSGYGINGGKSNSCNHGSGVSLGQADLNATGPMVPPYNPTPAPNGIYEFAIRLQYAIYATASFEGSFGLPIFVAGQQWTAFSPQYPFGFSVFLMDDGRIRAYLQNGSGTTVVNSAAGALPTDGTIHGIQISVSNLTVAGHDYEIVVDDVSVLSGTFAPTGQACGAGGYGYLSGGFTCASWHDYVAGATDFSVYHYRSPLTGPVDVMTNCAQVVIDEDPAIVSYPASNAASIGEFTCYRPAQPTVLSVQCNAGTITIDGLYFDPGATVELQGPEGVIVSQNIASITSTRIVLDTLDPPFVDGGRYCVTVTNPLV